MSENHLAFLKGPLQWLFKKDAEGKAVHGVISAARAWLDIREEALKQFEQQIRQTLAAVRDAKLLRGVTVIEKRATFCAAAGSRSSAAAAGAAAGGNRKPVSGRRLHAQRLARDDGRGGAKWISRGGGGNCRGRRNGKVFRVRSTDAVAGTINRIGEVNRPPATWHACSLSLVLRERVGVRGRTPRSPNGAKFAARPLTLPAPLSTGERVLSGGINRALHC